MASKKEREKPHMVLLDVLNQSWVVKLCGVVAAGWQITKRQKKRIQMYFIYFVCVCWGGSLQATRHNFLIKACKHLGKSPTHKMRKKTTKKGKADVEGEVVTNLKSSIERSQSRSGKWLQ